MKVREEERCGKCSERFHIDDMIYLNEQYSHGHIRLKYDSLVCIKCYNDVHTELEEQSVLKRLQP